MLIIKTIAKGVSIGLFPKNPEKFGVKNRNTGPKIEVFGLLVYRMTKNRLRQMLTLKTRDFVDETTHNKNLDLVYSK